jgi:hypothetical protein
MHSPLEWTWHPWKPAGRPSATARMTTPSSSCDTLTTPTVLPPPSLSSARAVTPSAWAATCSPSPIKATITAKVPILRTVMSLLLRPDLFLPSGQTNAIGTRVTG